MQNNVNNAVVTTMCVQTLADNQTT